MPFVGIVVVALIWLPGFTMSVGFLSESEELMNLEHVLENQTGMVNKCVRLSQAWELLLNAICVSPPQSSRDAV